MLNYISIHTKKRQKKKKGKKKQKKKIINNYKKKNEKKKNEKIRRKLELMFMKHYAPNICLYIKVAKLRTGLGSAEMSHLQNCSL